jgi:hypothetical protein
MRFSGEDGKAAPDLGVDIRVSARNQLPIFSFFTVAPSSFFPATEAFRLMVAFALY